MKGFKLYDKSNGKAVAEGVEFRNGKCGVCWFRGDNTGTIISIYENIEIVKNMHGCDILIADLVPASPNDILLEPEEFERVLNLIENPRPPTEGLKALFAKYKSEEETPCPTCGAKPRTLRCPIKCDEF